jgi:hypothetical protein
MKKSFVTNVTNVTHVSRLYGRVQAGKRSKSPTGGSGNGIAYFDAGKGDRKKRRGVCSWRCEVACGFMTRQSWAGR